MTNKTGHVISEKKTSNLTDSKEGLVDQVIINLYVFLVISKIL